MATKNLGSSKENIKIIPRRDDAIAEDLTQEEWDAYLVNLDESKLRFVEGMQPTRFLMKKQINYGAQQQILTQQMGIGAEGKPEFRMGSILEEVRCALVGIENPPGLPPELQWTFIKEIDGYASKELIAELHATGLAFELYGIRQSFLQAGTNTKK